MILNWLKHDYEQQLVIAADDYRKLVHVAYCYEAMLKDLLQAADRLKSNIDLVAPHIEDEKERFLFANEGSWLNNCCIRSALRDLTDIKTGRYGMNWWQVKPKNIRNLIDGFVNKAALVHSGAFRGKRRGYWW